MELFTVDFETYYDADYSLSKMSTEEYVTDPRFEFIGVALKKRDQKPKWFSGTWKEIFKFMYYEGAFAGDAAWLCHNTMFDALCSQVHFKYLPKMLFDTRLMAQAVLRPYMRSVSLDSCLKHIDLGIKKGEYVKDAKGRTRDSLSAAEIREYGIYAMGDAEGEYRLFRYLLPQFPRQELEIIDMTLRMYLQPKLQLDANLLAQILQDVRAKKAAALAASGVDPAQLSSNKKFAELLQSLNIEVPMKISPTTNAMTYAFSKNDTGFKELEEEYADDPKISAILAARIGVKSTIEESRTEKLLKIALRHKHLRVPLLYYAAHTGRYGGTEGINMQNPPRVDKSKLRHAIVAPPGHKVLALDLAQIEARINAWISKQNDLLNVFRDHGDPYSTFASIAYRRHIEPFKKTQERFVGKTCILGLGYGMSAVKLRSTLRKDGVKIDQIEADTLVRTYRETYHRIPLAWRICDETIQVMVSGGTREFGPVTFAKNCIILPNQMQLVYHGLKFLDGQNKFNYRGWAYSFGGEMRTLWGGKIIENIVQSLARILVMQYMCDIRHKYDLLPALQVHDELDYVVPANRAEELAIGCAQIMRRPLDWCPDLPIDVEANFGDTFGDCK